jgi:hypothetical protein
MRNLIAALALLLATGCTHNLQRPYVEAMEATRVAVEADVEAGLYKPDERSRKTLADWKAANLDAFTVLETE